MHQNAPSNGMKPQRRVAMAEKGERGEKKLPWGNLESGSNTVRREITTFFFLLRLQGQVGFLWHHLPIFAHNLGRMREYNLTAKQEAAYLF